MIKRTLCLVALLGLAASVGALAQTAVPRAVGKAGDWRATIAAVGMGDKLYTVEPGGVLYVTDSATGAWKPIGKPDFGNTAFLFEAGGGLYTIEKDGSLYAVNPSDGSWKRLGKPGDWKATIAGVGMAGKLYTVESGGTLYATDLATGAWRPIGKPDFGNTAFLFGVGGGLYTLEKDGSLYAVNASDGTWRRLGKPGDWKSTVAGVGMGGKLYTVEASGALYATDPATGIWKPVVSSGLGDTRFLLAARKGLALIGGTGNLQVVDLIGVSAAVGEKPAPAATPSGGGATALIGTWTGDADAHAREPSFKQQAQGNKQMADVALEMIRTTTLWVTGDTMTAEALGEKAPPIHYKVVSSSATDVVIEDLDGDQKGGRATFTFIDATHMKMAEVGKPEKAMFYKKK